MAGRAETNRTLKALRDIPSVGSRLGEFVEMAEGLAVVNIATSTIKIPYIGQYPAQPGAIVQIERRNGNTVCTGPANQRSASGKVTAVTEPKLTVMVDGLEELLPYDTAGYPEPAVNDDVVINWFYTGGLVQGRVSTTPLVTPPVTNPGVGNASGRQTFTALWSRSYKPAMLTNTDDVIFGESYTAAGWGLSTKLADTIADTATITVARMFLSCRQAYGATLTLGLHTEASVAVPGGLAIGEQVPVPGVGSGFEGWIDLLALGLGPAIDYLKVNGGGIGTAGPGFRVLKGLSSDGLSGALDIGWG